MVALLRGEAEGRGDRKGVAIAPPDNARIRFAQTSGRLDQRVKHGLQIEGRSADDLEYVGGGGLLLQRFGEVIRALAPLVEQAGGFYGGGRPGSRGVGPIDL